MPASDGFRARSKEVRIYLRSLESLEKAHSVPGRGFYAAAKAITASRASAFIMIYNCVEFATREAILELRDDIKKNGKNFDQLRPYWREDILKANFHDRLRQGTNHAEFLRDLSIFFPGTVDWGAQQNAFPFTGNIDHQRLLKFVNRIEYRWRPPRASIGGSDLELIRKRRNDLAHGLETFDSVGSLHTTRDIIEKFYRIKEFMLSFLRMIERYRTKQLYLTK